jgi:hypothetical protein
MAYGFYITNDGWRLIAQLVSSANENNENPILSLSRVAFFGGRTPNSMNPDEFEANGTSSTPVSEVFYREDGTVEKTTIRFFAQYRSDLAQEITQSFWLNRFELMVFDVENGEEVAIYRGDLSDYPQPVMPFSSGSLDVRTFDVIITVTDELEITVEHALAFITDEDMRNFAWNEFKPVLMENVRQKIDAHDNANDAHPLIQRILQSQNARVTELENMMGGQGSRSFWYDFVTLAGIDLVQGVWNVDESRIEF